MTNKKLEELPSSNVEGFIDSDETHELEPSNWPI